jgi:hypothetical protein
MADQARPNVGEPVAFHRDLLVPDSGGLTPLFDAVYWIASEGHARRVDGSNWDDAARTLIKAALSEEVTIIGTLAGERVSREIPALHWQGVVTDRLNSEPYLSLIGPANEHQPGGGEYQDELYLAGQRCPTWTRLAVKTGDIRRLWPFHLETKSSDKEQVQNSSDYYELPQEPPAGPQSVTTYWKLKKKYGSKIPKSSIQQIANNLPGKPSRESVQRALNLKK